jgi:hypothetical protein
MLDWTTGGPTARYWVLWMVLRAMGEGDVYVDTEVTNATALHAQALRHGAPDAPPTLLLVGKSNAYVNASITLTNLAPPLPTTCTATVVDETTRLQPPRAIPCVFDPASGSVTLPTLLPFATAVVNFAA